MNDSERIEKSLRAILTQLQQVLEQLSNAEYRAPLHILGNSSIGQHTRHIIEFFQTLVNSYDDGAINYDKRDRSHLLEVDQRAAFNIIAMIQDYVVKTDKEIFLTGVYAADSVEEISVKTTYHRELIYNLEHAIHHMAMIRIGINQSTNVRIPHGFGVAAATLLKRKTIL